MKDNPAMLNGLMNSGLQLLRTSNTLIRFLSEEAAAEQKRITPLNTLLDFQTILVRALARLSEVLDNG